MALMVCPECGYNVSERAEMCPRCGFKVRADQISHLKKRQWKIGFYTFLILTVLLFVIVGSIIGSFTYVALFVEALISLLITSFIVHTITGIRMKFYNYE